MAVLVEQQPGDAVSEVAGPALLEQFGKRLVAHRRNGSTNVDQMEQHAIERQAAIAQVCRLTSPSLYTLGPKLSSR